MSQIASSIQNRSEIELAISKLESILSVNPTNARAASKLMMLLDYLSPVVLGDGPYSDCQRALDKLGKDCLVINTEPNSDKTVDKIGLWQSVLNKYDVAQSVSVNQLYSGNRHEINHQEARCPIFIQFFKQNLVIPRLCYDCFKVQILPADIISLVKLFVLFKTLELPRDNFRKCMIEVREAVPFPYKAYIFCQSEEEAAICLELVKSRMGKIGLSQIYCTITHGCSEYGIEYPEFKYSDNGSHRTFKSPATWKKIQEDFKAMIPQSNGNRENYSNNQITVHDQIGIGTWINYAKLIGDPSCEVFCDVSVGKKLAPFSERVAGQSHLRRLQITQLKSRQSRAN